MLQEKPDVVEEAVPIILEPPPDSMASVAKLEWTCQKLGLPQPVYKSLDIGPKRGPASYNCTIKVAN